MSSTKLFKTEKVNKFFDILERLSFSYPSDKSKQIYKGYMKDNPDVVYTQRDVFVNRTINKWFKGKHLIMYKKSELKLQFKQYISISDVNYTNFGCINAYLFDYANPYDSLFSIHKFNHNDILSLEGEWCSDSSKHDKILSMFSMEDVPKKEYVFKAYDFNKYPKKVKKGVDPKDLIETTVSFKARTEYEAFRLKKQYEEETKSKMIVTGEIIKIK